MIWCRLRHQRGTKTTCSCHRDLQRTRSGNSAVRLTGKLHKTPTVCQCILKRQEGDDAAVWRKFKFFEILSKKGKKKKKKITRSSSAYYFSPKPEKKKKNCEKKRDSTDTVFLSGVDQSQTSKHVALFSVGLSLNVSSVLISVFPPSFLPFSSRPVLWPLEGVLGTPGT